MTDELIDEMDDYYLENENSGNEQSHSEETEIEVSVEEYLIQLVMARPPLWDSRIPLKERSKTIRDNLWLEIYEAFGEQEDLSVLTLIKKWRNLRDTYVRVKGEMESYIPSGSGAAKKKKKKWEYYDLMSFLSDTVKYRPTVSNVKSNISSTFEETHETETQREDTDCLRTNVTVPPPYSSTSSCDTSKSSAKSNRKDMKNVDLAIVEALNRVNAPVAVPPPSSSTPNINPICITISQILSKVPLKERTPLEIQLLQKAYDGARDFLN